MLEARHGREDGERFWPGAPHQTRLEARGELFLLTLLSDEPVLPQSVHARGRLLGPTCTPKPGRVGHQSAGRLSAERS